jgi:hypothetical protein
MNPASSVSRSRAKVVQNDHDFPTWKGVLLSLGRLTAGFGAPDIPVEVPALRYGFHQ